jgi:two-component system, NarL family, response regulator DegU
MSVIKVVIADDHVLFREGLKRILSLEREILVVGEAATCAEAVATTVRMRPDVLLMDLRMPAGDAVESLIKVGEKSPATKVMILTAHSEEESVLNTAKNRARGYVLKGISVPTLIQAIKKVNAGEIWADPDLPAGVDFARIAKSLTLEVDPPANETLHGLTKRELEILQLVAEGLSNEEIGKKVFISKKTVKTHLTNIFDKLQVNNRFKAALWVMPNWKKQSVAK